MAERGRVTLKHIAQAAGVATGTVSMVLNNSPLIAAPTRERVRAVMRDLGYVYDRRAAQLRSKRTNIVGVSICNLLNPYFAEVAAGIEASLGESGRALFLGNCAESVPRQTRFLETLREYKVEGALLMPAIGTRKATVLQMREWGIPVVMVSRYVAGVDTDYAGSDNRLGSMLATQHLLSLGHERIAFIGANRRTSTGRDRSAGFHGALKKAGIALAAELMVECNASREDGFRAIVALFRRKRPPTAVVCFNDLLAFGVMLGLRHLGLEPGYDCSVVGADDVTEAALWQPPLTTVAVDAVALGHTAGQLLRERIALPQKPAERVLQQPRLVVRASCGEAPSATGSRRT